MRARVCVCFSGLVFAFVVVIIVISWLWRGYCADGALQGVIYGGLAGLISSLMNSSNAGEQVGAKLLQSNYRITRVSGGLLP
eukprot:COSAG05_NODE_1747_length_4151_cov_4.600197_5_plen_82_part_00